MKITFVDLKAQYYSIKDKIDQAILGVIQDSAFTPQAMEEARGKSKHLKGIIFCKDEYEATEGADALVIITEWNHFRRLDFKKIKEIIKDNYVFDLRNIYSKEIIEKENGFKYFSVGR
jgi:UDPglucose 6-dehydrogenase